MYVNAFKSIMIWLYNWLFLKQNDNTFYILYIIPWTHIRAKLSFLLDYYVIVLDLMSIWTKLSSPFNNSFTMEYIMLPAPQHAGNTFLKYLPLGLKVTKCFIVRTDYNQHCHIMTNNCSNKYLCYNGAGKCLEACSFLFHYIVLLKLTRLFWITNKTCPTSSFIYWQLHILDIWKWASQARFVESAHFYLL